MSFPAVRPRKHQNVVGVSPALAELPPERRQRFELRMLTLGPLSTFDILAPEDKTEVLNVVLPLVDEALEDSTPAPSAGAAAIAG